MMNTKNVLSIACTIIALVVVWKVVGIFSRMFTFALFAGAIYLGYVLFIAPLFAGKRE
jgi:hypothetical protein